MALGLKPLLAILTFIHFTAWLFVIIATAITDWSKSDVWNFGIWDVCYRLTNTCDNWDTTELPEYKDCEGALIATQAFSVMSIIFVTFCMCISIALLAKPTLISKMLVLVNVCMVLVTNLWLFLGWIMYLGVEARGHCQYKDYDAHLGSSWFLQLFAWIFELVAIVIAVLIFMKWKKTPRYVGQPPFVPGPVPYGPPSAMYPQYPNKAPYGPYGPPVPPYASYPGASGVFGPTPSPSPYAPAPAPYW